MDIFIVINFCMCYVTYASSIGAPLTLSLQCSKYHFEEKVLEKLVRLELKIEMYEAKIKTWEVSIPTNLDKLDDARKQTNTFLESMQDILYQEQIRLNDSFEETVENIHLQSEIKVKSVLDSFSTKILQFENRREHALEHSTLLQEQERFKDSFQETVENIKTQSESRVKII
ncbi:unnamed protein product [Mytilus coruscus]|uniref:Uncharacterized protein n=1 Tax=Mytilus coruscus TaxID=42192 RepID=A0A6J8CQQ0_MYTCO|nr:unnamed protein product [Mytilus coruscus]